MFYSQSFPKSPAASAGARQLMERLDAELPESTLDDARLLVSELVANAVEHVPGDGAVEVRVDLADGRLRIEVTNDGPGFTYVPRAGNARDERGWGLHFTGLVANRWGIEENPTVVWFELDRP
ncbi:anti-sigma regulatory factor (Ser/Thr protein kinase) [Solirubrobacter pauli]|uniref:Anti-sigma regulatory factor (Ser/Thr protein kinase) n=1 Tax=Solirubrobacter pauli TaxID=166793 RepID=A0A660L9M4_9ACTN|nr:ATP-binding protein [Solirubrobacter pauli]RKQ91229.1 anti-sigma regulatory factor (Ser/Thr protein kinase) [Solirubrobacter pauli]